MKKNAILLIIALILISCSNPVCPGSQSRPVTTISFSSEENCHVRLTIYNDLEQIVKTLIDEKFAVGQHSVVWDGTDDAGNQVATGVYYYEFIAGDYCATRQMLLLK
ncbi:MAG: hypothetical protein KAS49_03945 [Candidatus Cloacimonetes bacterium]|nr:hypothetical protein [Candidatus Cloacimonadota bacterium]